MADPLSVISGIAGLITLSTTVVTAGYKFINTILSAPEEFGYLIRDTAYLSTILSQLISHSLSTQAVPLMQQGVLQDCENILRNIQSLIYDCERRSRAIHALLWPLKQNDILKNRERLSRLFAILQTAISVDSASTLVSIEQKQDQIILEWLSPLDHKVKHMDTTRLQQPNTTRWFLDEPNIREWLDRGTFVWLHGAMGIGKSVLV
jgi:hypothetical protein